MQIAESPTHSCLNKLRVYIACQQELWGQQFRTHDSSMVSLKTPVVSLFTPPSLPSRLWSSCLSPQDIDPGPPMTSGLESRPEESGKAGSEWANQSYIHQTLTVVASVTGLFLSLVLLCDLNFPKDCVLNCVRNRWGTYFHFAERLVNQRNHKFLSNSVNIKKKKNQ